MRIYGNKLYLRLAITLTVIFFSILIMVVWWQLLFGRTLDYYVTAEKITLENNILKGLYFQPEILQKLLSDKHVQRTSQCHSEICIKIPNADSYYEITTEYEKAIYNEKLKKLHMFYWETSFLGLILLVTIAYMFWVASREKKIQQEKEEFLAMTTHELKHPVSVISLLLESLQMDSLPRERVGEFIAKGRSEIQTLKKSLENILKLQEISFSKKGPATSYNLQDYLLDIQKSWQLHELNRENRIVYNMNRDLTLLCHVDKGDLQIILNNLIENALLYSREKIILETGKDGKGNYIQIQDTGLGFTDDDRKNFQKMFFRSRRHDIQNIRGSGLGHYIIKKLVARNSIHIVLESEGENKGSTFRLYIK